MKSRSTMKRMAGLTRTGWILCILASLILGSRHFLLAEDKDVREHLDKKEFYERFQKALSQMDKKHSEILILREIEDMDYEAMAAHLKCSIGTVMSRLHYARKKVMITMKDLYHESYK